LSASAAHQKGLVLAKLGDTTLAIESYKVPSSSSSSPSFSSSSLSS
jgi:hypothetical protein